MEASCENNLNLFQPSKQVVTEKVEVDINTEELDKQIGVQLADKLRGELELIDGELSQGFGARK